MVLNVCRAYNDMPQFYNFNLCKLYGFWLGWKIHFAFEIVTYGTDNFIFNAIILMWGFKRLWIRGSHIFDVSMKAIFAVMNTTTHNLCDTRAVLYQLS